MNPTPAPLALVEVLAESDFTAKNENSREGRRKLQPRRTRAMRAVDTLPEMTSVIDPRPDRRTAPCRRPTR